MQNENTDWRLKFSASIKPEPSDDALRFIRQLGLRYVYAWVAEEQITFEFLSKLKQKTDAHGLTLHNVGSFAVGKSDQIHLALPGRDERIARFAELVEILGRLGIPATTFTWEPDRVWSSERGLCRGCSARAVDLDDLRRKPFTHGRRYTREELWDNYTYFVERLAPVAEASGVRLALHPNDPPTDELGGIPCLINSMEAYKKAYAIASSPALAMEFCAGCWLEGGSDFGDILAGLEYFILEQRVVILHFRNITSPLPVFTETFLDNGYMDMYRIMRILVRLRYRGTVILDHTPSFVSHAGGPAATAYAIGYMRALYERALAETGNETAVDPHS